jgi:hypothetical protein
MWLALKIERIYSFGQKGRQPIDYGGLADQIRTVYDEQATAKRELLLYPDQGIVAAKKHRGVFDRSPGMVWIHKIAQNISSVIGRKRSSSRSKA